MPVKEHDGIMRSNDGFETEHNTPANNDAERHSASKKGHGYGGVGYGGGRDQTRPLPPTPYQQGRTVVGESDGYGKASLDGSMSHASHPQGAPYVGSPGAVGSHAKKVKWGEL